MAHASAPFGIGHTKPHHFVEMARVAWENRDNLPYAWKVLSHGVCDGCALGTSGLKDWTIDGTHLCMVRLELLRLNTMGAFDPGRLSDVDALRKLSGSELREMGRLGFPMRRRKGEPGFTQVSWQEAWEEIGPRWRDASRMPSVPAQMKRTGHDMAFSASTRIASGLVTKVRGLCDPFTGGRNR